MLFSTNSFHAGVDKLYAHIMNSVSITIRNATESLWKISIRFGFFKVILGNLTGKYILDLILLKLIKDFEKKLSQYCYADSNGHSVTIAFLSGVQCHAVLKMK